MPKLQELTANIHSQQ